MKITITIEDSLPWYHPYSSEDAYFRHHKESERRRAIRENGGWNATELEDSIPRGISPEQWREVMKRYQDVFSTRQTRSPFHGNEDV